MRRYSASVIPAMHNGHSVWLLRWMQDGVSLSHPYADCDDAMAVQFAMHAGQTFEEAHAGLYSGALDVDAVTTERTTKRDAMLAEKRRRSTERRARARITHSPTKETAL